MGRFHVGKKFQFSFDQFFLNFTGKYETINPWNDWSFNK